MRNIILALSDLHSGHKLGLLTPHLQIADDIAGDTSPTSFQLNFAQRALWEQVEKLVEFTRNYAKSDPVTLLIHGDITQGLKRPKELVSARLSDHLMIAFQNIEYFMQELNITRVRLAKGTGSHVFEEGTSEIQIGEMLKLKYPRLDVKVTYHGLMDIDGMSLDYAHHGPSTGRRIWLGGNEARYYLRDIMLRDIMAGKTPPRVFIRGHYHTWCKETLTIPVGSVDYESTLIVTPSMCFPDDFTQQAIKSPQGITFGAVVLEVFDGQLISTHRITQSLDIRLKEEL